MARSYIFSSSSLNILATPVSHEGRFRSKVFRSLVVSIRELCGRFAGVGKALVGTGNILYSHFLTASQFRHIQIPPNSA
jgi:hypothetical protein